MVPPPLLVAADHAGFELKERLKVFLETRGIPFTDLGTGSADSVDYPDFAQRVAEAVSRGEAERGVLVCGSGQGMAMAANRYPHVRAAVPCSEGRRRASPASITTPTCWPWEDAPWTPAWPSAFSPSGSRRRLPAVVTSGAWKRWTSRRPGRPDDAHDALRGLPPVVVVIS